MLQEIENWILKNFDYNTRTNNNDYTNSLTIEFENKTRIARFTLWDDKSCMIEIINIDTEKYIINERRELENHSDIEASFKEFVNLLT